jgi:hypothetical protein
MTSSNWPWAVWLTAAVLATACSSDDENEQGSGDAATTGGSSGSGTGGTGTGGGGTGGTGTGGSSTGGTGTGGSATGGSGGSAGGAAGAVGTGGAAGAAGTGNACDQLDACCDTTSTILRTNCRTIAATGMLAQCSAVMGIFCNGGVDGGTPDAGGGCAALQQCCATLSGPQRTQCETIAASGTDATCNLVAAQLCP